jgi:hypothetical protein
MHINREVREAVVELGARELHTDHKILDREVIANIGPGTNLELLAREHETSEDYVHEVCSLPPPAGCMCLTIQEFLQITGEISVVRDSQDLEPRICGYRGCT